MSTRCHIFISDGIKSRSVYHHCDGYPEGVGKNLKNYIERNINQIFDNPTSADFVCNLIEYDDSYELDSGFHGDEEYVYNININSNKVIIYCYERENWKDDNYLNWPEVKDFTKTYERDIN